MTIYVDKKFTSLLSPRLPRFKQKSEFLWNFRCPYCGDSNKSSLKARGYIYRQKNGLFFKCHNCHTSISLGTLIKNLDPSLYQEYVLEKFKENGVSTPTPTFDALKTNTEMGLKFLSNPIKLPAISSLPEHHFAKVYVRERRIPEQYYSILFYAENFKIFVDEAFPDHGKELAQDQRLVLPFWDKDKNLLGAQGRALTPTKSSAKYITLKTHEDALKVYGLDRVDLTKTVYVVEGPIDSLFLQNSIALMDGALFRAPLLVGPAPFVFVYDNEPRNAAVVSAMTTTVERDFEIFIWPKRLEEFKDINDMVKAGYGPSEVQSIIDNNRFSGLRASMELNAWSRV